MWKIGESMERYLLFWVSRAKCYVIHASSLYLSSHNICNYSAKGQYGPHAGSAGFLASLVTYGNSTLRMKGILTDEKDVEYARQHLDKDLMDIFGYAPI